MITAKCPSCGQTGKVSPTYAGKNVTCPCCKSRFNVLDETQEVSFQPPKSYRWALLPLGVVVLVIFGVCGWLWWSKQTVAKLIEQGRDAAKKEDWDLAIAHYTKALELDKGNVDALSRRGYCYGAVDKFDLGLADCSEAIRISPGFADAYCSRAGVYRMQNKLPLALSDAEKAVQYDNTQGWHYLERGRILVQMNRFGDAITDFDMALTKTEAGKDRFIRLVRSATLLAGRRYEQVREEYAYVRDGKATYRYEVYHYAKACAYTKRPDIAREVLKDVDKLPSYMANNGDDEFQRFMFPPLD